MQRSKTKKSFFLTDLEGYLILYFEETGLSASHFPRASNEEVSFATMGRFEPVEHVVRHIR